MNCNKCGHPAMAGDRFCGNCGAPLAQQMPAVNQAPQVPAYNQAPQVPAVNQAPQVPAANQAPQVPAVNQAPQVPAVNQAPQVPAYNQAPQVPAYNQAPQVPAVNQAPQVPAANQAPQVPAVNQAPQVPAYNQAPQAPAYNQAPQVPVVNDGPEMPITKRAPQVPAANKPQTPPAPTQRRCKSCFLPLRPGQSECSNCGTLNHLPPEGYYSPEYGQLQYMPSPDSKPMAWFKFIIYFQLWAGAVLNFLNGIQALNGSQYSMQGVDADLVYSVFPGLETADMFYGIMALAMAVFAIVVRFRLAGYNSDGPNLYLAYLGAGIAISLIYGIWASSALSVEDITINIWPSLIGSMIGTGIMLVCNAVYFGKRKDLFY